MTTYLPLSTCVIWFRKLEKTMSNVANIEAKLVGSGKAKQRRADLVREFDRLFADGGPHAVTDETTRRMDTLFEAFVNSCRY
jgi:hypothetical protein